MLDMNMFDLIHFKDYGYKLIKYTSIEGTDQIKFFTFRHKIKEYNGIITKTGNIITPISTMPVIKYFSTKDKDDYCFIHYDDINDNYESYHIKRDKEKNKYFLQAKFQSDEKSSCRVVNLLDTKFNSENLNERKVINNIKDNYWIIEKESHGIIEVALYSPKQAKVLTPFFNYVRFETEESRVLAYFQKDIYSKSDGVRLTTICGFIDYNGNFITPFYDQIKDEFYDASTYNLDKTFFSFNAFIETRGLEEEQKHQEENAYIDSKLEVLLNNLYSEKEVMPNVTKKAKIIQFRGGHDE